MQPLQHSSKSAPSSLAMNPATVKTTSHYLRALRRRFWMVLSIAVPLGNRTRRSWCFRLPSVYMAKGEIEINPPAIDPELSALMTHDTGRHDPSVTSSYVPNQEARLRSKGLAQKVVSDPSIAADMAKYVDPAFELFKSLTVVRLKNTNLFIVSLEGADPAQTRKLLDMLLIQLQTRCERRKRRQAREHRDICSGQTDKAQGRVPVPPESDRPGAGKVKHDRARRPEHPRRTICESRVDHVAETAQARRAAAAVDNVPDDADGTNSTPKPAAAPHGLPSLIA